MLTKPYKGYTGTFEFYPESDVWEGYVIGTKDVITFSSVKLNDVEIAFKDSVDDYLEFCAVRKTTPDTPSHST